MTKSKSVNQEDYVLTSKHPSWLDRIVPNEYFDDDLYQIVLFFVIFSPCSKYCTQGRSLQYYGWKDKPWNTNRYLKSKLDEGVFDSNPNYFRVARTNSSVNEALHKAKLEEDFFDNISEERVAFLNIENCAYMSLFHHIRCALAHGRLAMYPTPDKKDIVLIMENGIEKGAYFQVKARMVIKKGTLKKWIQIITKGPQEDENTYYYDVYKALLQNSTLKKKDLKLMLNESEYAIDKAIKFLRQTNIIEHHNHGSNSWWEINVYNAEQCFKNIKCNNS